MVPGEARHLAVEELARAVHPGDQQERASPAVEGETSLVVERAIQMDARIRPSRGSGISGRTAIAGRIAWALVSWWLVESLVFALAVLPAGLFWLWHFQRVPGPQALDVLIMALTFAPAYVVFALTLMGLSALAARALGWRTPRDAEMPIAEIGWPLLRWVRYAALNHVVRVFAGSVFRSTPVWTFYLRLNGARVGRHVYVNTLAIMDHNLIELDEDAVIGSDVSISGHIVEGGVVRTAPVRIGRGATIGIGSVIGIGVVVGDGARVGALSVVPKFREIEPGAVYVGGQGRREE
jgi:acetyltransferase-like isoleucine patch superfamily enzyme